MFRSYPDRKAMPSRMARKKTRSEIFLANRKAAKLRRKATRARSEDEE